MIHGAKGTQEFLSCCVFDALLMFHISQGRFSGYIFLDIDGTFVIRKTLSKYFKFCSM